jgi:hypothetical protein
VDSYLVATEQPRRIDMIDEFQLWSTFLAAFHNQNVCAPLRGTAGAGRAVQPAATHPEFPRFAMGPRICRAGWAARSCWASSAVTDATLCSASARAAAVARTSAMSSCKAVLSIAVPVPSSPAGPRKSVAENVLPEA